MGGRRRVQDAVDEEHFCFLPSRSRGALGLASTASRARACWQRAGAWSQVYEAVLCGAAAFAQGLRCAKLCRASDEPCTLASLGAPTSSCSLGALFPSVLLDASRQDTAQH